MRAEVKLGIGVSLIIGLFVGGYYMFFGEREKPIPMAEAAKPVDPAKPDANANKTTANNQNKKPGTANENSRKTSATNPGARTAANQPPANQNPVGASHQNTGANPVPTNPATGAPLAAKTNPHPASPANPSPSTTGLATNSGPDRATNAAGNPTNPAAVPARPSANPSSNPTDSSKPNLVANTPSPGMNQPAGSPPNTSSLIRPGGEVNNPADRSTPATTMGSAPREATGQPPTAPVSSDSVPPSQPIKPAGEVILASSPASQPASPSVPPPTSTIRTTGTGPGSPGASSAPNVAVETHRVQPGETFSSLAENYYGNRRYAQFLIDSNPDVKDARKLAPGTTIKIPAKPSDDQLTSASRERSAEKPATISSDASAKTGEKPKTYKVKEGDSFYSIAKSQLGGAGKWKKLYELNKKLVNEDPTNLKPGQVLKLPET